MSPSSQRPASSASGLPPAQSRPSASWRHLVSAASERMATTQGIVESVWSRREPSLEHLWRQASGQMPHDAAPLPPRPVAVPVDARAKPQRTLSGSELGAMAGFFGKFATLCAIAVSETLVIAVVAMMGGEAWADRLVGWALGCPAYQWLDDCINGFLSPAT